MSIGPLRETEAMALLQAENLGRLGCISVDSPYVVPVNYFFDGQYIYSHSLPGKKIDALRSNPRTCLQVDEIKNPYSWRSVIAYGTFEEVADEAERRKALARLYSCLPHLTPVESRLANGERETIVFRIRVDEVTGMVEEW
jgi:nitroimidazol reductase NimA-like FMN-containing flavoprotein (pyridoxamine 5'-phosphate oxidase superfamily)